MNIEGKTEPRSWYSMAKADGSGVLEIYIYDAIGYWNYSAADFVADASSYPGVTEICLRINSPGGDLFDGLAIYNFLRRQKCAKTCSVDGLAASAATLPMMACDKISMPANAMMLCHFPWTICVGNADQLRKEADALDRMGLALGNIYASRTGKSADDVAALLADERMLSADEAKALGLCDEIIGEMKMAAKWDPSAYRGAVASLAGKFAHLDRGILGAMDENKTPAAETQDKTTVTVTTYESQPSTTTVTETVTEVDDDPAEQPATESAAAATAATVETVQDQREGDREQFKNFLKQFGAERAAAYFSEGLTLEQATARHAADLQKENDALKAHAAAAKPAAFSPELDQTPHVEAPATWADAMKACGGNYAAARKKHPAVYEKFMAGK